MRIQAHYDCLYIASRFEKPMAGASLLEIQRTAYLGCILSLYCEKPYSEWGYSFVKSDRATPFSEDLSDALTTLVELGFLINKKDLLLLSERGKDHLADLTQLPTLKARKTFLDAACDSSFLLPPSLTMNALHREPSIRSASLQNQPVKLLNDTGRKAIYLQFQQLIQSLDTHVDDLLIPSVLWLTQLNDRSVHGS